MSSLIIEGFGYLASVLLAISLVVNNDLRFRWLNSGGCLAFIIYGVLINAFPIILTNTGLLLINLYTLLKIYKKTEAFELVEFDGNNALVQKFIGFYEQDINAYFPHFTWNGYDRPAIRFMVLRDMNIANIFIATIDQGVAEVKINYTIPKYRDYKVGRFIFDKEKDFLQAKGIKKVVYKEVANKSHLHFLEVMGFKEEAHEGSGRMVKQLP